MEKKCLISKGHINKYIIFALIAGVSKCFVSIMIYKFKSYAKYNEHPLIIGFNAGLGMSLSLIPLIIVKVKSHREIKIAKLNLNQTGALKQANTANTLADLNYLEKYDKKKLRIQKFLILLACAFLDFLQKFLSFFLNKLIINNIWMFNIIFISVFDYFLLRAKLYKHQYISSIIIVLLGIAATTVGLYQEKDNIFFKLFLCICIEIMFSLSIVLSKFLMDYRSCTPYEVTFYEGIFALIVNSILLAIFTNMPITDESGELDELLKLTKYNGKIYIDHFFSAFKEMTVGEVFFFILSAIGRLISNLFGHIVVKHYTSSHIILVLILGEMGLAFKKEQGWKEIVQFALFCLALFMLLIFTEIIEINACGLEKNTRKNIELRERLEEDDYEKYYGKYGSILSHRSTLSKIDIDDFEIDLKSNDSRTQSSRNDSQSNVSDTDSIN
jgi:hypothetical protein